MPSSRHKQCDLFGDFTQMPLDIVQENQYIITPSQGVDHMNTELFDKLETKISELLARHGALKDENNRLAEENNRLQQEREGLKERIDAILSKFDDL